jgi:hypothetical protein
MDVEGLEEEVEGARLAAARRVAEWLTVPDDLQSKLPKLRANVHAGQLATDAQLRALVQAQLDSARTGLDLLRLSTGRIANVQAKYCPPPPPSSRHARHNTITELLMHGDMLFSLSAVDKLCEETQGLIGQYELIKAGTGGPFPPLGCGKVTTCVALGRDACSERRSDQPPLHAQTTRPHARDTPEGARS